MVYRGIAEWLGCIMSLVMFLKSDLNFFRQYKEANKPSENEKSSEKLQLHKQTSLTLIKWISIVFFDPEDA